MKIKNDVLEEICANESIIKDLSIDLNITCSQVKDLLIEYALNKFFAIDDGTGMEVANILKHKYMEIKNEKPKQI
jgi:D-hexose-6-phosphate mutarotase